MAEGRTSGEGLEMPIRKEEKEADILAEGLNLLCSWLNLNINRDMRIFIFYVVIL